MFFNTPRSSHEVITKGSIKSHTEEIFGTNFCEPFDDSFCEILQKQNLLC